MYIYIYIINIYIYTHTYPSVSMVPSKDPVERIGIWGYFPGKIDET